jgi:hypothetical protein
MNHITGRILARTQFLPAKQHLQNAQIADQLNQQGHTISTGRPYTASMIQWIRYRYRIPPTVLKKPEELTVQQVAQLFGVSDHVVYYWIQHKIVQARKLNAGSPCWITLGEIDQQKLRDCIRNSNRIHTGSSTHSEAGAL